MPSGLWLWQHVTCELWLLCYTQRSWFSPAVGGNPAAPAWPIPQHAVLWVLCWFRSWWHRGWKSHRAAISWAQIKAGGITMAQGSGSRAAGIYYPSDKRIPRRCARWWNNCTLGMNQPQSQVRGVLWPGALLALRLQWKRMQGGLSGILLR